LRRAARTDGNHDETLAALRELGAKTHYLREPVDLLVGFRGVNVLLELKDGALPPSHRQLTAQEVQFIGTWPGLVYVVTSPEEAVRVVAEAARPCACRASVDRVGG
jgi:hypothetical protein